MYVKRFSTRSLIGGLLLSSRPSHVARLVISIIVYAVKRHAGRLGAYVVYKCRKIITPFVAHCNTAPAVVFKTLVLWVEASLSGIYPCGKFDAFSDAFATAVSVNGVLSSGEFVVVTTATFSATVSKASPRRYFYNPTIAAANPSRAAGLIVSNTFNNNQSVKSFSNKADEFHV